MSKLERFEQVVDGETIMTLSMDGKPIGGFARSSDGKEVYIRIHGVLYPLLVKPDPEEQKQ